VNDVHPDLIVADIGLPGEDGYAFIRQVRARENNSEIHVPALALTAFATSDDRHRAVDAGYDMHFAKGADPRQLIAAIVALTNAPQSRVQG
jgi:CheY-like chemotaxis protein